MYLCIFYIPTCAAYWHYIDSAWWKWMTCVKNIHRSYCLINNGHELIICSWMHLLFYVLISFATTPGARLYKKFVASERRYKYVFSLHLFLSKRVTHFSFDFAIFHMKKHMNIKHLKITTWAKDLKLYKALYYTDLLALCSFVYINIPFCKMKH